MITTNQLKIQVSLVDTAYFVLGESRLGQGRLGNYESGTNKYFVLGQSRLNQGILSPSGGYDANSQWVDLASDATSLNAHRGAKRGNQPGEELEVGTMAVSLIGPNYDPAINNYIHRGVPIRVLLQNSVVFVGNIWTAQSSYDWSGRPRVTINAVDVVNKLSQTRKSNLLQQGFGPRVDDLLASLGIQYAVTGSAKQLGDYAKEDSVLNHLQRALNTDGGYMFVNRAGNLQVRGGNFDTTKTLPVSLDLTDGSFLMPLEVGYDSQALFNSIIFKNTIGSTETTIGPYQNGASIGRNGLAEADVETNFRFTADAQAAAQAMADKYAIALPEVKSVSIDCTKQLSKALIDLYQVIRISYYNQSFSLVGEYQIISIDHKVTPQKWRTTLQLIPYIRGN
ncbi:hypothetical protein FHN55_17050 [Streptomyces sp. NP160]|uniref:hypothetical protein n=1 Tax=Streptomyces sp. NP160 TaxID=2586637 RepID=UPI00111BA2EF|nr:hypothetical protein [Streptomyces sp. NP160]TNM61536.1 hypothetical protein FHN55_17050 [Streptomyces sp. NP160]